MEQYIVVNEKKLSIWLLEIANTIENNNIPQQEQKRLLKKLCEIEETLTTE